VTSFRVGFTVPDGRPVDIEARHLGITGMTQASGKTTALEAFMDRADETAIAFRTSRGELGFHGVKRIGPYFRERTDWRFVEGLISAHLMEKAKFYRGDLIRLTRGTHGLSEVHANIRKALAAARAGSFQEKIYTELNEYITEIRDALESVRFDPAPNLTPGRLSVMDLEALTPAVQQLVIAATVDWLMEGHLTVPVIVVLPEARDFIPEDRRTPAKLALENLIRKGARVSRYLWLDSQALTGLDMDVCRSIGTWFFGCQQLDLEIRRVGKMVPGRKLKPDDVRGLALGQFLLVQGEDVKRVYVQPAWLPEAYAHDVATGKTGYAEPQIVRFKTNREEKDVDAKERKEYDERLKRVEHDLGVAIKSAQDWKAKYEAEHARAEANARTAAANAVDRIKATPKPGPVTGVSDLEPGAMRTVLHTAEGLSMSLPDPANNREHIDLRVTRDTPSLKVHERVVTVEAQQDTHRGKLALLIADGFFATPRKQADVAGELKTRGWGDYKGGNSRVVLYKNLQEMTGFGFFRYDGSNYEITHDAAERIEVVREKVLT